MAKSDEQKDIPTEIARRVRPIKVDADLDAVLTKIILRGPYAPQNWRFDKRTIVGAISDEPIGWLLRGTFDRLDRDTERRERGSSREEFIPRGATVNQVVKTCWVLVDLTTRHEAMESFTFEGARIFDPHHDVEDLAALNRMVEARGAT